MHFFAFPALAWALARARPDLVVHVVEKEDFPLGEGIQRGFYSGAQQDILFGRNEPGLIHFHRSVSAAINA